MTDLEKKITSNDKYAVIIVNDTFSSKYLLKNLSKISNIKIPYEVINIEKAIFFAQFISLIAIPAVVIFNRGKIQKIHRGICVLGDLEDMLT